MGKVNGYLEGSLESWDLRDSVSFENWVRSSRYFWLYLVGILEHKSLHFYLEVRQRGGLGYLYFGKDFEKIKFRV